MLDDLYQADTDAAINDLIRRPLPQAPQATKFNAFKTLSAVPRGLAAAGLETMAMVPDVAQAVGGAFTAATADMLPEPRAQGGAEFRAREKQRAKDQAASSMEGDTLRQASKPFMPDPATAHAAEQTVFGLVKFGAKAVGSVVTAGPMGGAAAVGLNEGLTTADDLKTQGVDLATRTQVGAVSAVASAAGVILPVAGKTAVQTAGLVALGGPGAFMAQQVATREILQGADYSKLADQYDPFDPVGLAVSTLVPAGFGAWALRGAKLKAKAAGDIKPGEAAPAPAEVMPTTERSSVVAPTPDQVDAARVEMLTQHVEGARLTAASDVAGARAHDEAMTRAMDQIAKGEPVQVADVAPVPRATPTDTTEFKAWFGDSKVVDEGGKPLVLYHATPRQFDEFKTQGNQTTSGDKLDAAFFTDSADYVEAYAIEKRGQPVSTVPAYVAMRNPLIIDAEARGFSDPRYEQPIIEQARAGGHDGVIFRDEMTGANFYAVFEPQQIKSAIGNSGKFDPGSPSLTDSRFATWADQINAAVADIRAAAQDAANAQTTPQTGPAATPSAPPQTQPQAAATRSPGAASPGEQGGGVSRAGSDATEAAVVSQRLADIQQQFPDLSVQMDGMDKPMPLSEFLAEVQREAMEGTDFDIGGNDAPLMQVAANCFLLNG